MADVAFLALVLAVFGLLAAVVRGVTRMERRTGRR
jgi:hypothetical protein